MADFEQAFETLMRHEGGYSDNPDDKGGETKFGISKNSYPRLNIANLTLAEAKEIYKKDFWIANRYDEINDQEIAKQIFDLAVNCGAKTSNKILQQAYNFLVNCLESNSISLIADGCVGDRTLDAVNSFITEGQNAIFLIVIERIAADYYNGLRKQIFINGWLNRLFENVRLGNT